MENTKDVDIILTRISLDHERVVLKRFHTLNIRKQ